MLSKIEKATKSYELHARIWQSKGSMKNVSETAFLDRLSYEMEVCFGKELTDELNGQAY